MYKLVPVQQVPYVILFLGEFLATAILMYIGCMGCVLEFPGGPILPAFAFGFSILTSVQVIAMSVKICRLLKNPNLHTKTK